MTGSQSVLPCLPTRYRYEVYEDIRDVNPEVWNRLHNENGDPFMDLRFLEAVQNGMAAVSKFWHVVFMDDDGQPVATASLCSYRADAALLANGMLKRIALGVGRAWPGLMAFNVMFCGLCFSAGQSHLRFAADVDPAAILRDLDALLLSLGRQERAKCIVFKEFRDDELPRLESLPQLGYQRAESLPMNQLTLHYRDFEDFCAAQKSDRRYAIRKSRKKFAASGLRVVQMAGGERAAEIFTDDVYRLFETVYDRAKVRLEKVSAETFRELARCLPDSTAWTFIYQSQRVVAFAVSLFTPWAYHQMFVGYETSLNAQSDLYFNLFFHALDRAYRQNVPLIHVGQSADEFKRQKLNCQQQPLYFYIKGIDWATRSVLRRFGTYLFPPRYSPRTSEVLADANGNGAFDH